MALKWALISSAYNIVLGHVADANPGICNCNSKIKYPDGKTDEEINHGLAKTKTLVNHEGDCRRHRKEKKCISGFQMPLHYPRYKKADYEKMEEWKLDMLLQEYGLNFDGNLEEKKKYAMGAFLWPDQM